MDSTEFYRQEGFDSLFVVFFRPSFDKSPSQNSGNSRLSAVPCSARFYSWVSLIVMNILGFLYEVFFGPIT